MVGRIEDPKTLVEILIFGFKQSSASSPQIVFHLHHYRSVRDEDNGVVGDDEDEDDDGGCVEGRDKRALAVRCDPFHQARPGKVAHHYLHIGPTLQFLPLHHSKISTEPLYNFYILVAQNYNIYSPPTLQQHLNRLSEHYQFSHHLTSHHIVISMYFLIFCGNI